MGMATNLSYEERILVDKLRGQTLKTNGFDSEEQIMSKEAFLNDNHHDAEPNEMTLKDIHEERRRLLNDNYEALLETLTMTEGLASQVNELRDTVNAIKIAIPKLESLTSYEAVEQQIVKPHRERTGRLRETMRLEQEQRQKTLIDRAIHLLQSNIALPTCLRLVSTLKQQRAFITDPAAVSRVFLTARTCFITTTIEAALAEPEAKLFEALVKVMREPVLEVVTQYKAVFSDLYPLARFLVERMDWFCTSVSTLVGKVRNTLVLASYWNQLVLLNTAYAAIGAAFLNLMGPIFVKQASMLLAATSSAAVQHVRNKLTGELRKRSGVPTLPGTLSAGKDLRPPIELSDHPALVLVVNSFVDVFDQMRLFAIPPLRVMASELVREQIVETRELINARQNEEERTVFDQVLAPFVHTVLDTYFDPTITDAEWTCK
jgi:hypothetical protein